MRGSGAAAAIVFAALLGATIGQSDWPALAQQSGSASASAPADERLARGQLLFTIGGCTNCHTAKGGPLLAGGDPIKSPYGIFYAPNITPDPETGIGGWSEADFVRAMREGRSPRGRPYYPAFPYTSFTQMSDADLVALKSWLDTVPSVRQSSQPHDLSFPYDLRFGLYGWQWMFFTPARFQPDPARDEVWNRGAYLVNAPGHCQQCHTPRNWAGALDESRAFTGGNLGPGIGKCPNITGEPQRGIGKWGKTDLASFFQIGIKPDGDFVGSEMAKVVNNATSKLPDTDVEAIVTYLKSLPPG